MPCSGVGRTVTRALQPSRQAVPNHHRHTSAPQDVYTCLHQLPGLTQPRSAARVPHGSHGGRRALQSTVCRAQKQEEKEKDMVGGFDVDSEPGFLESEAVGIVFKVGFVAFISAGVAAILLLARPVIDNTIKAFPYRTSGGSEQSSADPQSLIPGLENGDSQGPEDSIF